MIPQSFIQELLARIDIVEVVGRAVKLRKAGANFSGLCPFHAEKTPSFTVSPSKQFYHCFGCGAHGSAIGFLMEHGGLGYVDAITELAQSLGLEVPQERGGAPTAAPRDPGLLEALADAARFYKRRLADSPRAIDYLKARGLGGETAAAYRLGYAPEGWRALEAAVADYQAEVLVTAGLVIVGDEGSADGGGRRKRYDRFRDRIMFPIRNARGQVIGFGGRVLERGEPKYLNSPETPVFSKGRELYGMYEAREALRAENRIVVVEGYMDVVMLAQHGIRNAVATLGTATTADHVRKLLRAVDRVVFAFDGDAAGRKAAWRALESSLGEIGDTKRIDFLFLPPEHDPDSFVRARGAAAFREALDDAMPLSGFLLQELAPRDDERGGVEARAAMLARARPLLGALSAPGLRMQLVHAVAEQAGVSVEELQAYLEADTGPSRGIRRGAHAAADQAGGPMGPAGGGDGPPWDGFPDAPGRGRFGGPDTRRGRAGRAAAGWGGSSRRRQPLAATGAPDLARRVRLLAGLNPGLAGTVSDRGFLPERLLEWLEALEQLAPNTPVAEVFDALSGEFPEEAIEFERDARVDAGGLRGLSQAEAAAEMTDALDRMRQKGVEAEIRRLVEAGIRSDEERNAYHRLMALQRGA